MPDRLRLDGAVGQQIVSHGSCVQHRGLRLLEQRPSQLEELGELPRSGRQGPCIAPQPPESGAPVTMIFHGLEHGLHTACARRGRVVAALGRVQGL
eukprot:scaffold2506_cov236-Pinguiococcus_pyrenoidosus.AAC.8